MSSDSADLLTLTAGIVASYLSNPEAPVDRASVATLITDVHRSLAQIASGQPAAAPPPVRPEPAVPIKKSIQPDYLVCLNDGRKMTSLKRHLRARYGLSPEQYREMWGLPADYPMVAPNYAARRSELAREMGLGQIRARNGKG